MLCPDLYPPQYCAVSRVYPPQYCVVSRLIPAQYSAVSRVIPVPVLCCVQTYTRPVLCCVAEWLSRWRETRADKGRRISSALRHFRSPLDWDHSRPLRYSNGDENLRHPPETLCQNWDLIQIEPYGFGLTRLVWDAARPFWHTAGRRKWMWMCPMYSDLRVSLTIVCDEGEKYNHKRKRCLHFCRVHFDKDCIASELNLSSTAP